MYQLDSSLVSAIDIDAVTIVVVAIVVVDGFRFQLPPSAS